jgi:hypothetical protein
MNVYLSEAEIDAGVITHGNGIAAVELNGAIQSLRVSNGLEAADVWIRHDITQLVLLL